MPDPALRVGLWVCRGGECGVGGAALFGGTGSVGGRPHQWMPEAHAGTDLEQLFRLGRRCRTGSDAKCVGGTPDERGVTCGVGRRKLHQSLRRLWERSDALPVVVL